MTSYRFAIATIAAVTLVFAFPAVRADEPKAAETVTVFGTGTMKVPAGWAKAATQSPIIEHEFVAKAGEGDDAPKVRITMMAASGGVTPNIERWKGQFTGGDAAAQKTEDKKIGALTAHIVDLSGSFSESMGGGPFAGGKTVKRDNYAMTGIILESADGRLYFIKVTGPMEVVKANRPAVMQMLDDLK